MNDNFNDDNKLDDINEDEQNAELDDLGLGIEDEVESDFDEVTQEAQEAQVTEVTQVTEEVAEPTFQEQEVAQNIDEHKNQDKEQFNSYQHMHNNPYFQTNFDPNQQYPPYGYNQYNPNQFMQRPYVPPNDPRLPQNFSQMPPMYPPNPMGVNPNMEHMNKAVGMFENPNENPNENSQIEDETYAIIKSDSNIRTFATIVSILLVISVVSFAYYFMSNSGSNTGSFVSNGNSPSMEISYTPDYVPVVDPSGSLTNNEIYVKVSPAVVGIAVYTKGFGQVLQSEGSGIVMSEDGFVVTNYHVIASDSSNPVVKIEVIMSDGETYEARVIGGDSKTDLAVVKIDAVDLIPAEFGDSSKLKIGDRVAVIGNPSGIAFASSFTSGCVSALSRSIYMSDLNSEIEYIQTDAAINSGNSGGAFINEYGQVVGISAAKMRVEAGYEGMGFAIPINNAKTVIDSLIEYGYVAGRPRVGIEYKAISPTLAELNSIPIGLRVYVVGEDVDAYEKILPGDIITMFDGEEVYDSETVASALADKRSGEELLVTIYRVDEETGVSEYLEVTIILSESVGEKLAETMY